MSYSGPDAVAAKMAEAAYGKSKIGIRDLLIRGFLSGSLLGFATSLAFTVSVQTGVNAAGALIFPVGFVMIVLLGFELVTGNFALMPLAVIERKASVGKLFSNWTAVFTGNLLGSLFYAAVFYAVITRMGHLGESPIIGKLISASEAKVFAFSSIGADGLLSAFLSGILCNWMVSLGVVLSFTSSSVSGKVLAMWLPIVTFFAQGFEHSVVNMFVIPEGMMLGSGVGISDWWLWNQIPVTLGNIAGGMVFTGLSIYLTHRPKVAVLTGAVLRKGESLSSN